MRNQLKDLMKGDSNAVDDVLRHAEEDKNAADQELKAKLAKRKAA